MQYDKGRYAELFQKHLKENRIKKTRQSYKTKLYLQKAENSLMIAKHVKEILPDDEQPKKMHWNYWAITISYYSMLYAAKSAINSQGYETRDHDSAQIALGHLLVPGQLEKEDLMTLDQAHKIFEEEYIQHFEDAKKESHIARYSAIKTYTERRLEEIFNNAKDFVAKISLLMEDDTK